MVLNHIDQPDPEKRILIIGGSSAVGQYAIQIAAKIMGAHVTAICSSANFDLVKGFGAHTVLDYKSSSWKDEMVALADFDAIFDTVGGDYYDMVIPKLKEGPGVYASTVFPTKGTYINGLPVAHLKGEINDWFLTGKLTPLKVIPYKLEDGVVAHKASESHRTVGKIVLQVE